MFVFVFVGVCVYICVCVCVCLLVPLCLSVQKGEKMRVFVTSYMCLCLFCLSF